MAKRQLHVIGDACFQLPGIPYYGSTLLGYTPIDFPREIEANGEHFAREIAHRGHMWNMRGVSIALCWLLKTGKIQLSQELIKAIPPLYRPVVVRYAIIGRLRA